MMTLEQFDKLRKRDFENGAVLDEIREALKSQDELRRTLINVRLTLRVREDQGEGKDRLLDMIDGPLARAGKPAAPACQCPGGLLHPPASAAQKWDKKCIRCG